MEKKETGEAAIPGLYRTAVQDEGRGLHRLIWALEVNCPLCGKFYTYEFKVPGRPDPGDVLLRRVVACAECAEAMDKAQAKNPPTAAKPSRKRKKTARRARKKINRVGF